MADTNAPNKDILELQKSNKKRFWRLLEVEVIQGPEVPLARIIEKYKLKPETVYKYSARHKWKEKKDEYRKAMLSGKSAKPADRDDREIFRDFLSRQVQLLTWRVGRILAKEAEHIQRTLSGNLLVLKDEDGKPKKDEKGNVMVEDPFDDNVSLLQSRVALMVSVQNLGLGVYGEPPPREPPDMIFQAIIKEQRISYIQVSEIGDELPPIEVEVPAGMAVSDTSGRPDE